MSLSYLRADSHKQAVTHIRESRRFESMYTLPEKFDKHTIRIPRSVRRMMMDLQRPINISSHLKKAVPPPPPTGSSWHYQHVC
jgi:hypothetical protein